MSAHTPGSALRQLAPEDDGAISAATSAGDTDSRRLRALMANYHSMVWRTVRNFGVAEADVDDAVQQVFIVAANKLGLIKDGCERSFLAAVAVRVASRARRTRNRRREEVDVEAPDHPDTCLGPVEELDRVEARRVFMTLLDAMSPDLRSAFVMYEVEELTLAEIATALELPLGTVASRVRRARQVFVTRARKLDGGRR